MKVFLILETQQTFARTTISDLKNTLCKHSIPQLEYGTTIDFALQKSGGEGMAPSPLPPILPALNGSILEGIYFKICEDKGKSKKTK